MLLCAWSDGPAVYGAGSDNTEYAVKAAFLFHFAQLTNWPAAAFQHPGDPLTFCTAGKDPFNGELERVLAGKTVSNHAIRIHHLKQLAGVQECNVLFISASENSHLTSVLASVDGLPILTTGETDGFVRSGGMIGFQPEQERLRFEINVAAADKCKMSFSSELLSLAKTVIPR